MKDKAVNCLIDQLSWSLMSWDVIWNVWAGTIIIYIFQAIDSFQENNDSGLIEKQF